jgi:hypothetical protein
VHLLFACSWRERKREWFAYVWRILESIAAAPPSHLASVHRSYNTHSIPWPDLKAPQQPWHFPSLSHTAMHAHGMPCYWNHHERPNHRVTSPPHSCP